MATATQIDPYIRGRFDVLVEWWRADTGALSSPQDRFSHPAYQEIIGMGPLALPLIFRQLEEQGGWWFHALKQIVGESQIRPEHRQSYDACREDWLTWGREHGYLPNEEKHGDAPL